MSKPQYNPVTGKPLVRSNGMPMGECCCEAPHHYFERCDSCYLYNGFSIVITDEYFKQLFPDDPNDHASPTTDLYVKYGGYCYGKHAFGPYGAVTVTSGITEPTVGTCADCIGTESCYWQRLAGGSVGCGPSCTANAFYFAYSISVSFPDCPDMDFSDVWNWYGFPALVYNNPFTTGYYAQLEINGGIPAFWLKGFTYRGHAYWPTDVYYGSGCQPEGFNPIAVTGYCNGTGSLLNGTAVISPCTIIA